MATINPSIAMGVRPIQIENPLNQMAALSQIQSGQNQNALAQYQLSAAQRADESTNIQNQLYAKHYDPTTGRVNTQGLYGDLAKSPVTAGLIPKLQAQEAELKYKQDQGKKIVSEISKLNFETGSKIFSAAQDELKQIDPRSPDAPAQYLAYRKRLYANPELADFFNKTGLTEEATNAQVMQAIKTPQGLADTILKSMTTADQFQKILQDREQLKVSQGQLGVAQGNLSVSQQRLQLEQNKEKRDLTMGAIPAGYRLNKDTNELEAIPGGPTTVPLAPKELQAREAKFPQATTALKTFDSTSDNLIKDLERLKKHPGLSNITGVIAGRTPSLTVQGREAQALYDKIIARGGFQELQSLRQSSPTGGALGNVSNQEGQSLRQAFGALDRTQDASSIRNEIDRLVENIGGAKTRVREAFDMTYDYKNTTPRSNTASPATPNAATVNIKSNAEYDALPSGTIFVDPNGQQRRKP
jgi:hypothetical protein